MSVAAAIATVPAEAGFVTSSFSGIVPLVTQPSPYGVPGETGQSASGFFAYDTSSPDLSPGPNYGQYAGASPPSFGVDFGTANAFATAGFLVSATLDPIAPVQELEVFTSTVVAADALPPATLTIADFDVATGLLRDVSTGERVDFRITSLAGVPSPGMSAVMTVLGGLLGRRRSR